MWLGLAMQYKLAGWRLAVSAGQLSRKQACNLWLKAENM